MSKGKSKGFDWQTRLNDRDKSLSIMSEKVGLISKEAVHKRALDEEEVKQDVAVNATLSKFGIADPGKSTEIDNIQITELGQVKHIADNYYSLGKLLLEAKSNPSIYFILSWPCSMDWLVISQFLVNESLLRKSVYSDGLKLGIYPASTSAFWRLKKFRIDRKTLIKEAQDAANRGTFENDRIMAYLALQEFSKIDAPSERENPCLKDLTPCFFFHDTKEWLPYGDGYLSDIYTYMFQASGNSRRKTIYKASESLNEPQTTTEGIFLAPSRAPSNELLKIFKTKVKIDAIVLDAKERNIEYGNITKADAANVFQSWFHDNEKVSLVIMFDNPLVMNSFRREVFLAYKKTKIRLGRSDWFKQYAFLHDEDNAAQEIVTSIESKSENKRIVSSPKIAILGLSHIAVFVNLIKLALEAECVEPKLAREMKRAIGFLLRISNLPISQSGLLKWVKNVSEGWPEEDVLSLSRKYLWNSYIRAWKQRVSDFNSILSTSYFEDECQKIYSLIKDTTETNDKVLQIASDCLHNQDQKTLIVTVERKSVDFIEEIVSSFSRDELAEKIDVVQISRNLNLTGYNRVAVFGLNDRKLKEILSVFSDKSNCNEIYINAYSSLKIHRELRHLRNIEAFSDLYGWIDGLNTQIEPIVSSLDGLDGLFSDNTNEITRPYDNQNYDHDGEKYAKIHLSGYGSVEVSQHSTLIRRSQTQISDWEATTIADLLESDRLVVIDDSFVEIVAKITHSVERTNEEEIEILRSYFSLAQNFINSKYKQEKRKARANAIRNEMTVINSDMASQVTSNMIERWLKNIEEFSEDDSDITSRSARKQSHYLLFAKAINLDESIATVFWQEGIKQFRSNSIQEGRRLANHIRHLLVGMLDYRLLGISENEYDKIKSIARDKEFSVEMITLIES